MKLFEEYLSRHGLNDIPIVQHYGSYHLGGALLSKSVDSWILITIKWVCHDYRPGSYEINIISPIHNSYDQKNIFKKESLTKKWDEYEDFLIDWSKNSILQPICEKDDIIMSAWEMLVYICDEWFSKQSCVLRHKLFNTLNKENNFETRYLYYSDVIGFLSEKYPNVVKSWKSEIFTSLNWGVKSSHADWLARLLGRRENNSYEKEKYF